MSHPDHQPDGQPAVPRQQSPRAQEHDTQVLPSTSPLATQTAPPSTTNAAPPRRGARARELTAIAALAALLSSGGTYAAVRAADGSPASSPVSTASTDRGASSQSSPEASSPVVQQASADGVSWTATAQAVAPSVVSISVETASGSAAGSGVVYDKKGHILTNNHVVSGGQQIMVTLADGRSYAAKIAGTDPTTDLAVLTIADPPSDLTPIALGRSSALKVGDPVMAVGNPLGLSGTVTTGIVSALDRPVSTSAAESQEDPSQGQSSDPYGQGQLPGLQQGQSSPSTDERVVTNAIQTSASINPGNSGGALVDAAGRLVGINSSIASLSSGSGQSGSIGIGFAIPVDEARTIATQLIQTGKATHAYLGVALRDGSAKDGSATRAGALIGQVSPGSPGAKAGLRAGDVVIAVGDDRVDSADALIGAVRAGTIGTSVKLTLLRDGSPTTITATLAARPSGTN